MFAVIFEVQPKSDRWDDYLRLAGQLRPELGQIAGFIANERFRSRRTEGRVLSLSTWADEKAVIRWRTHAMHHTVQERGRNEVFQDYHLRVGEVTSDSAVSDLPQLRFDTTMVGTAKYVSLTEAELANTLPSPPDSGVVDAETYESITTPGKTLLLISWRDAAAADSWQPPVGYRHRQVRIIRDYGLADRREAPQYYPEVTRPAEQR